MARHLAPMTAVRLTREAYAAQHPFAATTFDTHRHSLGLGKRSA